MRSLMKNQILDRRWRNDQRSRLHQVTQVFGSVDCKKRRDILEQRGYQWSGCGREHAGCAKKPHAPFRADEHHRRIGPALLAAAGLHFVSTVYQSRSVLSITRLPFSTCSVRFSLHGGWRASRHPQCSGNPVQRHRFPETASRISSSEGSGCVPKMAPGSSENPVCKSRTAARALPKMPAGAGAVGQLFAELSTVAISCPAACTASSRQERAG
jgi:ribosome modulation factor